LFDARQQGQKSPTRIGRDRTAIGRIYFA